MASRQGPFDCRAREEVERTILACFDEVERQWGGEDCKKILRDWFPRLLERTSKRKGADADVSDYKWEIEDAFPILEGLRDAFSRNERCDSARNGIWAWPTERELQFPPKEWLSDGTSPADTEQLTRAVEYYIECPWLQHNTIDGAAINAFLFSALSSAVRLYRLGAFGRTDWAYVLRGTGSNLHPVLDQLVGLFLAWIFFPVLKWIMLPAISVILVVEGYNTAAEVTFAVWISFLLYGLVTLKGRSRRKKDADRTTGAMRLAWEHSCGCVINPARLRELVVDAEQKGAINYPPVLHTLIDRAIQRDPTALRTGAA